MFTGLIEEVGRIARIAPRAEGLRIAVDAPKVSGEVVVGDSVSVNGSCLTAVSVAPPIIEFDAVRETVDRTTLFSLRQGAEVNLEQALRAGDRMGGHIVQGHVDGSGKLIGIEKIGSETLLRFSAPPDIMQYIAEKGSIAVDGVSLTVASVGADWFSVAVIPHTLISTTLCKKNLGSAVNLETDIIGKYVFKYVGKAAANSDEALMSKLSDSGFLD